MGRRLLAGHENACESRARLGRVTTLIAALVVMAAPALAEAKRNVYVTGFSSLPNNVATLDIGADGALATNGVPAASEAGPIGIGLTPNGKFAYVANYASDTVSAFTVSANGVLVPSGAALAAGTHPYGVAVSPDGAHLFVANNETDDVSAYSIDALGTLSAVPGSPFAAGNGPAGLAVSPDGAHLYVADLFDNSISVFSVASGGALTAGAPVTPGVLPNDVAVTPDGRYLYAANTGGTVAGFSLGSDGVPVALSDPSIPANTGAVSVALAISPDASRLYVANKDTDTISAFTISTQGGLTAVAGSPFAAGDEANALSLTPDGKRLYVANAASSNVSGYNASADGVLAPITGSPFAAGVTQPGGFALAITPDQGPTAALTAAPAPLGSPSQFSGSGSSDPDGNVASYAWDFGDGSTATTSSATTQHAYAQQGSYTVKLTVTDDEGCSTAVVFTGKTASCNGSSAATAQQQVTTDTTPPRVSFRGSARQKLSRTIKLRFACDEACLAVAQGTLFVTPPRSTTTRTRKTRKFKLAQAGALLNAGQAGTIKIKLSERAFRAAKVTLAHGGKLRARIRVVAVDRAGNHSASTRKLTLKKR